MSETRASIGTGASLTKLLVVKPRGAQGTKIKFIISLVPFPPSVYSRESQAAPPRLELTFFLIERLAEQQ